MSEIKINVDLCEELNVSIYSFPMKYHPIIKQAGDTIDYSHNRDFIGEHWNRKYIRAVQAVMNSTKGKIGKGYTFFYKAFGKTETDFYDLLEMPETFILYRLFFESLEGKHEASTANWRNVFNDCMQTLNEQDKTAVLEVIHKNKFTPEIQSQFSNPKITQLLEFYTNYRNDIITPGTELYKLKQEYESDPNNYKNRAKRNLL